MNVAGERADAKDEEGNEHAETARCAQTDARENAQQDLGIHKRTLGFEALISNYNWETFLEWYPWGTSD
jgi:hypothetical protein